MKPDDILLVVAREAETHRASNRISNIVPVMSSFNTSPVIGSQQSLTTETHLYELSSSNWLYTNTTTAEVEDLVGIKSNSFATRT